MKSNHSPRGKQLAKCLLACSLASITALIAVEFVSGKCSKPDAKIGALVNESLSRAALRVMNFYSLSGSAGKSPEGMISDQAASAKLPAGVSRMDSEGPFVRTDVKKIETVAKSVIVNAAMIGEQPVSAGKSKR